MDEIKSKDILILVPNNNSSYKLRHSQPFYIDANQPNYLLNSPITRICSSVNTYFDEVISPIGFNLKSCRVAGILK